METEKNLDPSELPENDDAFDIYVASESFNKILRVEVMEKFLLRAAKRFHVLNAEQLAAVNADRTLPLVKQEAWEFMYFNFGMPHSDLRMFFSETDDYHEQTPEERRRLNAVADALVCSAKDKSKIASAEALGTADGVFDFAEDDDDENHVRPRM